MENSIRIKKSAIIALSALSLVLVQLPHTAAPGVTYCLGPAAYPPDDLTTCIDPVVEAKKEADRIAAEQKAAAETAAEKAAQDKRIQEELANQIQQALKAASDAEATKTRFAELAKEAEEQEKAAKEARDKAETAAKKAQEVENEKRDKAEEIRKKADEAARNLAADQAAAAKRISEAQAQAKQLEQELKAQQEIANKALEEFKRTQEQLASEIKAKKDAEDAAKKAAEDAAKKAADEEAKLNVIKKQKEDAQTNYDTAKINYENSLKATVSLKSNVFFINPEYDNFIVANQIDETFLTTEELKTILDQAQKIKDDKVTEFSTQEKIANELAIQASLTESAFSKAKVEREQTEAPLIQAETNMKTASTKASTAQTLFSNKQNEVLLAEGEKVRIEQTAKNLAVEATALETQVGALVAARQSAEAQLIALTAQAEALEKTKIALAKVADSTESAASAASNALNQIQTATNQIEKVATEAKKAADVAETSADEVSLKVSKAAEATEESIKSLEESRIANENLLKAAADRAAAEAANKPKPITDREYALLVAAANKEREEAALKKAAEDKAKAEAEEALKTQEAAQLEAQLNEEKKIDDLRRKAEEAKREADRLAEKAAAEMAVSEEKARAAIEAAKEKAQKLLDKIKSDLGKAAEKASANADKFREKASQLSEREKIATSVFNDAKRQASEAKQSVALIEKQFMNEINQVKTLEKRLEFSKINETRLKIEIVSTENKIRAAIKKYENIRTEISELVSIYNTAKAEADDAAKNFAEKQEQAMRSKTIAVNALEAYKTASKSKNLVSSEKPESVANPVPEANIEMAASFDDISKLRQLADQAQDRYLKDRAAADAAQKIAENSRTKFEKVKSALESKVETGREIQTSIRSLQDILNEQRKNVDLNFKLQESLIAKIRSSQGNIAAVRNKLTQAKLQAQRAEFVSAKAALQIKSLSEDAKNANKIADANELALAAAKDATVDIEVSSNLIDKIVSSEKVDSSIKSLPAIATITMSTLSAVIAVYAIARAIRRRRNPLLAPTKDEDVDLDLEFDFDQILAEIKAKQSKTKKSTQSKK